MQWHINRMLAFKINGKLKIYALFFTRSKKTLNTEIGFKRLWPME